MLKGGSRAGVRGGWGCLFCIYGTPLPKLVEKTKNGSMLRVADTHYRLRISTRSKPGPCKGYMCFPQAPKLASERSFRWFRRSITRTLRLLRTGQGHLVGTIYCPSEEVSIELVQICPAVFQHFDRFSRQNREVCLQACKARGGNLEFAEGPWRDNLSVCKAARDNDFASMRFASERVLRLKSMAISQPCKAWAAVRSGGGWLVKYVSLGTLMGHAEVLQAAIRKDPEVLQYLCRGMDSVVHQENLRVSGVTAQEAFVLLLVHSVLPMFLAEIYSQPITKPGD